MVFAFAICTYWKRGQPPFHGREVARLFVAIVFEDFLVDLETNLSGKPTEKQTIRLRVRRLVDGKAGKVLVSGPSPQRLGQVFNTPAHFTSDAPCLIIRDVMRERMQTVLCSITKIAKPIRHIEATGSVQRDRVWIWMLTCCLYLETQRKGCSWNK